MTRIRGRRITVGTCVTFAKSRIREYPMRHMATLAKNNPRKMAYTYGAFSRKSIGPGWMPWTMRAPIMIAVAPSPGIPRVKTGMKAPPLTALLPASGAATPSGSPWPKLSLWRLQRFAWS